MNTKQLECICHDGFYRDGDACRSEKGDDTDEGKSERTTPVNFSLHL